MSHFFRIIFFFFSVMVASLAPAQLVSSLAVSPTTIIGGQGALGIVTISSPAPSGGFVLVTYVSTSSLVTIPTTVTVPEGETIASFPIATKPYANTYTATFLLYAQTDSMHHQEATLTVLGDAIESLTLDPAQIIAGQSTTGTVTIASAAPPSGFKVDLTVNDNLLISVPASVTIPSGASTASFPIASKPFSRNFVATLVATSDAAPGFRQTAALSVIDDNVAGVSLASNTLIAGQSTTGTVTISNPAPPGGLPINLTTNDPAVLVFPSSITVPNGATSVTFPVQTKTFNHNFVAAINATDLAGVQKTTQLTVTSDIIQSFTLGSDSFVSGLSTTGTVNIPAAAPTGGFKIDLSVNTNQLVSLPSSVTIPAGSTSISFPIQTKTYNESFTAILVATTDVAPEFRQTASLDLKYFHIAMTVNLPGGSYPTTIAGYPGTGSVVVDAPAPVGGWVISLSSKTPMTVSPSIITIPAGQTSANFSFQAPSGSSTYTTEIDATVAGSSSFNGGAQFEVTGLYIYYLTVDQGFPDDHYIPSGESAPAALELGGSIPPADIQISISSDNPNLIVPSSITVLAGTSYADFTIATKFMSLDYQGVLSFSGLIGRNNVPYTSIIYVKGGGLLSYLDRSLPVGRQTVNALLPFCQVSGGTK